MDLIDNFNQKQWSAGDANDDTGFSTYRIASRKVLDAKKGDHQYAIFTDDGDLIQVTLNGAGARDPLDGVGNVDLRVDLEKRIVTGVILLDECVLFSG